MTAITLEIAIVQDGDTWLAQCLTHDVCAQGDSFGHAAVGLMRAMTAHFEMDLADRVAPFVGLPPAPVHWLIRNTKA